MNNCFDFGPKKLAELKKSPRTKTSRKEKKILPRTQAESVAV